MNQYVLDACALLAVLNKEDGAELVRDTIDQAKAGSALILMSVINLLEVYYGVLRECGEEIAEKIIQSVNASPIKVVDILSNEVFKEAGRLKAAYRISLADSIALAEASVSGASLLTSDHHEFDAVEESENIIFHWIR